MKSSDKGFTLIEVLISITIMALASGAAGAAIFQILRNTERNSDHMNAVRQVENAGYWISRDAEMSSSANATGILTPPNFLVLNWTEWDASGNPTSNTARYFFENLTNGIGTLKRNHWNTAGTNEYTLIAQEIYYNPGDPANTSNASFQDSLLTVKLTSRIEQAFESKEYKVIGRPKY